MAAIASRALRSVDSYAIESSNLTTTDTRRSSGAKKMSSNEFPLGGVAPFGDPGDFDDLGGGGGGGGGRISNYTPQEYMRELALWLEFELGVGTTLREEALETGATFTPGAYLMLL